MTSRYSYLFVPATRAERFFEKLRQPSNELIVPFAVIFDLEDSIPDSRKSEARELLSRVIREYVDGARPLFRCFVRINDFSTPYCAEDIEWLRAFGDRPFGIKLPKCRNPDDIKAVEEFHSAAFPVFPTIETLDGYKNRDQIMAYAKKIGVERIGFGAGDMALELGVERNYSLPLFRHLIFELILTAKLYGLDMIDSTSRVLPKKDQDWESRLAEEVAFSFENGFAGKKSVHPAQVPIIERHFRSDDAETNFQQIVNDFAGEDSIRAVRSSVTGDYIGNPSLKGAKKFLLEHNS